MSRVAIAQGQSNTSLGTQDFTTTDFAGETPKAAIVIATFNNPLGTRADHARMSMGVTDGTRERCVTGVAEDGSATTDTAVYSNDDRLVYHRNGTDTADDGIGVFDSFITNGIRIDWTDAPSSPYSVVVILIGGFDASVYVDDIALPAQDVETDVTAPGFEPDWVFAIGAKSVMNSSANDYCMSWGFGVNISGQPQRCIGINYDSGEPNGDPRARHCSDRIATALDSQWRAEIGSYDTSGFSVWPRNDNGAGETFIYLAVKGGTNDNSDIVLYDTPTSTGNNAVSGFGFQPNFVFLGLTQLEVLDSNETDDTAGSNGFGAFDPDDEYSGHITDEDGAPTSDTSSYMSNQAAELAQDDKSAGHVVDFVSFDADGFTLDFTSTLGTVKKWFAFVLKATPDPGDRKGQVSWTELQVPTSDTPDQAKVSWTEFEVPGEDARPDISWTELEVPPPAVGKAEVSWTAFAVPCLPACTGDRGQLAWTEFEVPDTPPVGITTGQVAFAEMEFPDVAETNGEGQVSFTEFIVPNVNTGGTQGASEVSWGEMEIPTATVINVTRLRLETPDPRRRGRVSWAALEYPDQPLPEGDIVDRQTRFVLKDINRDKFLEELDAYYVKPDIRLALAGFTPLDPGSGSNLRIWTPIFDPEEDIEYDGEDVETGEVWLEYSWILTSTDLANIEQVIHDHNSTLLTDEQIQQDQDAEDYATLEEYVARPCNALTNDERNDALCRMMRLMLRYHPNVPELPDEYEG